MCTVIYITRFEEHGRIYSSCSESKVIELGDDDDEDVGGGGGGSMHTSAAKLPKCVLYAWIKMICFHIHFTT